MSILDMFKTEKQQRHEEISAAIDSNLDVHRHRCELHKVDNIKVRSAIDNLIKVMRQSRLPVEGDYNMHINGESITLSFDNDGNVTIRGI